MAFGTPCKPFNVVCKNTGSLLDVRHVALVLFDVRESLAQICDIFRVIPTEHMCFDRRTNRMPSDRLTM